MNKKVINLINQGLTVQEVADLLHVSEEVVKVYGGKHVPDQSTMVQQMRQGAVQLQARR